MRCVLKPFQDTSPHSMNPLIKITPPLAIIKLATLNIIHLVDVDHKLFVVLLHILFYHLFTAQLGFLQCCVDTVSERRETELLIGRWT